MIDQLHGRVLIVGDDSDARHLLSTELRQKPLTLDEASDGGQAISLLREHSYAVVLLPHTDRTEVLEAVRSDVPRPPVVLVISGADRSAIEKLDPNRIHGVIRKPFDPQDVAAIVAACAC